MKISCTKKELINFLNQLAPTDQPLDLKITLYPDPHQPERWFNALTGKLYDTRSEAEAVTTRRPHVIDPS